MQYVRQQNAALKSDGFGIFLTGFLRLVLGGNLEVALVLGVVCIGVKGFFCGSAASALLWLFRYGIGEVSFWWVMASRSFTTLVTFDIFVVRGTLHPIVANQLEVVVLLSLYLAVLDDQSNEEQFIAVYNTYKRLVYHTA